MPHTPTALILRSCNAAPDPQQPLLGYWVYALLSELVPESTCADPCCHMQATPIVHISKPNDMTCPLCMYVVSQLKSQIDNPVTQEQIQQYSLAACGQLPEGMMRDGCTAFVEQYGKLMLLLLVAD